MKYWYSLSIVFFLFTATSVNAQKRSWQQLGIAELTSVTLTPEEVAKISSFNFNPYRKLSSRSKVQVSNGPLLELLSVKEMEARGNSFDDSFKKQLAAKEAHPDKYDVIPLVNAGIFKNKTEYPAEIEKLIHQ